MEFPLEQEKSGGTQEFLLQLRDSRLTDDMLLSEFYDKVIENYDFAEHYLILLIHAAYDVLEKLPTERKCLMLQIPSTIIFSAASAR